MIVRKVKEQNAFVMDLIPGRTKTEFERWWRDRGIGKDAGVRSDIEMGELKKSGKGRSVDWGIKDFKPGVSKIRKFHNRTLVHKSLSNA